MKFLLIIAHDDQFQGDPALVRSIQTWVTAHTEKGIRLVGAPLKPPSEARTINPDGSKDVSHAPFSPGPLHTAAFELIECPDMEAATTIAQSHPMATRATIEVRPVWEELLG